MAYRTFQGFMTSHIANLSLHHDLLECWCTFLWLVKCQASNGNVIDKGLHLNSTAMQSQTTPEEAALLASEQLLAELEQAASKAAAKKAKKGKQKAKKQLSKQQQNMDQQQPPEDHAQPAGIAAQQSTTDSRAAAVLQQMDQMQLDRTQTNGLCIAQTAENHPADQSQCLPAKPTQALHTALALPGCEQEACSSDAEDVSHLFRCPITKVQLLRTAPVKDSWLLMKQACCELQEALQALCKQASRFPDFLHVMFLCIAPVHGGIRAVSHQSVQETMVDPVIAADGKTYEKEAMQRWLQHNTTSPCTGAVLKHQRLVPNMLVKAIILAGHH